MDYGSSTAKESLVRVVSYISIIFLITLPYDAFLMKYFYDLNLSQYYQLLLTIRNFIPFASVLITLILLRASIRDSFREYGLRRCKFRFLLLSGLVPFLMYFVGSLYATALGFEVVNPLIPLYRSYGANLPAGGEGFLLLLSLLSTLFVGSTILCLIMLGQEVGWRGLLLDESLNLIRSPALSNLLVGVVWGLWYSPLIILYGVYFPDHRDVLGVLMMSAVCASLSLIFSHLKLKIGSLLAPAAASGVLNGLHNLMLYTVVVGDSLYAMPTGLLGIASMGTVAVVLRLLWR